MAYDGRQLQVEDLGPAKDEALDVLEALVKLYISNPGTTSEFVSCITPSGPMLEWERAKLVLQHANRL